MKNQLATIAKHASLEAARRYAMKPSDGPGINAHSCAPDAAIDFLSDMGYNPTDFDEEAVAQAQCLLEAGYCIGSEAADDRWKDAADEWEADNVSLATKLAEAARDAEQIGFDYQLEWAAKDRRIAQLEAAVATTDATWIAKDRRIAELEEQLALEKAITKNLRASATSKIGLARAVKRAMNDLEVALHDAKN